MGTALTLFVAVLMVGCLGSAAAPLPGTDLGAAPAPDFRLTDAEGRSVALSDYRGRPVAVTFLYTDCPDVCPVIARRLGQAMDELGNEAGKVAVLAVSVDPDGDTPEKARAFMAAHGLTGPAQHYLLGDAATLAPVWLAYGIGTIPIGASGGQAGGSVQFGRIGHTDALFLIDRDGQKRTLLRSEATAKEIAGGLRTLLR